MSNHARGLWGYSGPAATSATELTIQSTGMGGPSAALVLADLAELGVERAIRVGTCTGLGQRSAPGELLSVEEALAVAGSIAAFGFDVGDTAVPDPRLRADLEGALGENGRSAIVASLDTVAPVADGIPDLVVAADLQTAAVLARAPQLGIAAAAVLIVAETEAGDALGEDALGSATEIAGKAAAAALLA
jgi:uridine phosphorylase